MNFGVPFLALPCIASISRVKTGGSSVSADHAQQQGRQPPELVSMDQRCRLVPRVQRARRVERERRRELNRRSSMQGRYAIYIYIYMPISWGGFGGQCRHVYDMAYMECLGYSDILEKSVLNYLISIYNFSI